MRRPTKRSSLDTLSVTQFLGQLRKWFQGLPEDPGRWTFGNLKRQKDGSFPDASLVDLLTSGSENVAGIVSLQLLSRRFSSFPMLSFKTHPKRLAWPVGANNSFRGIWSQEHPQSHEGNRNAWNPAGTPMGACDLE